MRRLKHEVYSYKKAKQLLNIKELFHMSCGRLIFRHIDFKKKAAKKMLQRVFIMNKIFEDVALSDAIPMAWTFIGSDSNEPRIAVYTECNEIDYRWIFNNVPGKKQQIRKVGMDGIICRVRLSNELINEVKEMLHIVGASMNYVINEDGEIIEADQNFVEIQLLNNFDLKLTWRTHTNPSTKQEFIHPSMLFQFNTKLFQISRKIIQYFIKNCPFKFEYDIIDKQKGCWTLEPTIELLDLQYNIFAFVEDVEDLLEPTIMKAFFEQVQRSGMKHGSKIMKKSSLIDLESLDDVKKSIGLNYIPASLSSFMSVGEIVCNISKTVSNSIRVEISQVLPSRNSNSNPYLISIQVFMSIYALIRKMIHVCLVRDFEKIHSSMDLKDVDRVLFEYSIKGGGYSRVVSNPKCNSTGLTRYRQPTPFNPDSKFDLEKYKKLKYPDYWIKYRGVCYVGMRDELENGTAIEKYNRQNSKKKLEYFRRIVMIEIHDEKYRRTSSKFAYPCCLRKDKLSPQHLQIMRNLFMNGDIEFGGVNSNQIKKLLMAEPVIKTEINYVLQGLRTLSIGGYAHLPPPDINHWFRLNAERFVDTSVTSSTCLFVRKGTIQNSPVNLLHCILDALNIHGYHRLTRLQRTILIKNELFKIFNQLSFFVFRYLDNGNLARQISFYDFKYRLKNYYSNKTTDCMTHRLFASLLSHHYRCNIAIFIHKLSDKLEIKNNKQKSAINSNEGFVEFSNPWYDERKTVLLLLLRKQYEPIILSQQTKHKQKEAVTSYNQTHFIMAGIQDLRSRFEPLYISQAQERTVRLDVYLREVHETIPIAQTVNSFNQCTHLVVNWNHMDKYMKQFYIPVFPQPIFESLPIVPFKKEQFLTIYQALLHLNLEEYLPSKIFTKRGQIVAIELVTNPVQSNLTPIPPLRIPVLSLDLSDIDVNDYKIEIEKVSESENPFYEHFTRSILNGDKIPDERMRFIEDVIHVLRI